MDHQLDDDDIFPYNNNEMPTRSRSYSQSQYYNNNPHQQSSSPLWQSIMWILDVFTGPNFGVWMAVLVILLLQLKSSNLLTFFHNAMEDGLQQTLLECMLGLRDVTRAYYQMACELIRSLRQSHPHPPLPRGGDLMRSQRSLSGSSPPPLVVLPPEEGEEEPQQETHRNNRASPRFPKQTTPHESSCVLEPSRSPSLSTSSSASSIPHAPSQDEIEPAFLDEKDYPPGWLVYHPLLGVVTKEEADNHDRENPQPSTTTTTTILAPSITASG